MTTTHIACLTRPSKMRDAPPLPVVAAPEPVKPGRCACGLRLSVANHDGVCDSCAAEQARVLRWMQRGDLCRCGRGPRQSYGVCRECHRQYAREYRRKLRLKKAW